MVEGSLTLSEAYTRIRQKMSESDARYIIQKRTPFSAADLIAGRDELCVSQENWAKIQSDLQRYLAGEPLSRIYEEGSFWGLDFELSPDTLDPRIDTEVLIEAVFRRFKGNPPQRILDLGTGTGCIIIALLSEFPDAIGVGADLSFGAVQVARRNAQRHGVEERCSFVCGKWGAGLAGEFDLIVSNPPYISNQVIPNLDENVQKFDPILALDGGQDGLQAYKMIFSDLSRLFKKGGYGFFEIGFDQEKTVVRLSEESRFFVEGVYRDSAGHPRVVEIFSGKRNGDK